MQILTSLLAQATTDTEKITEIYNKLHLVPDWAFRLWPLVLLVTVGVVLLFLRQKKIAQNQVALARLVEQLLDKQK